MAAKWQKTTFPGVRFREHAARKHGVQKDRYFSIYYKVGGKRYEEALGWASEGMTATKAAQTLAKLKEAHRTGEGPTTLAERREAENAKRKTEARHAASEARKSITFLEFFNQTYFPDAEITKKPETVRKEREHVKNWIAPAVKDVPMRELTLGHMKKIRAAMVKAGRSARMQQYVFQTFSVVWRSAQDAGLVEGPAPNKSRSFRLEKINNERERFLSLAEAEALLEAVQRRSPQAHDMTLLALYCGLRFGEIAALTWDRIDMESGVIRVLNAKGDKSRSVPMPARVKEMFLEMTPGLDNALVFPDRKGGVMKQIPSSFKRAVENLGLNKDISDPKKRFSFHGLRHTNASWMVQAGVDLYRVQKHLGHSSPVVTQRYGHLEDKDMKAAVQAMERRLEAMESGGKVIPMRKSASGKTR